MPNIQDTLAVIRDLEKKGDFTTLELLQERIRDAITRVERRNKNTRLSIARQGD